MRISIKHDCVVKISISKSKQCYNLALIRKAVAVRREWQKGGSCFHILLVSISLMSLRRQFPADYSLINRIYERRRTINMQTSKEQVMTVFCLQGMNIWWKGSFWIKKWSERDIYQNTKFPILWLGSNEVCLTAYRQYVIKLIFWNICVQIRKKEGSNPEGSADDSFPFWDDNNILPWLDCINKWLGRPC